MLTWRSWLFVFIIGGATTLYWQDQYFDMYVSEELEKLRLLNIYNIINNNPTVLTQLSTVDISGFRHKVALCNIQYVYGFNSDVAELLYKYHRYHGAQIGDHLIIIEDVEQLRKKTQFYEDNRPGMELAAYESARYKGWRYSLYLLFIYIISGPPGSS